MMEITTIRSQLRIKITDDNRQKTEHTENN